MKLTKTHRSALLFQLKQAEKDLDHRSTSANNLSQDEDMREFAEIDHYLAKERVRIITEALTENEIDY